MRQILQDDVLPLVEKPSRYLGTELNAVHKDLESVDVRIALTFPDLYDLGLGNLGVHILYAVLNGMDGVWCERAYAPALDLEAILRERGLPLFANESKDSLAEFDGVGFTLQSELTYTNILNVIDLAGLPLRAADRDERHPLLFAGGPAVFNPEPIAPFFDCFVMGDGEDIVIELVELIRATRGQPRIEVLTALSKLEGVYVPALYPMDTLPDGRILPAVDGPIIKKRTLKDLNGATFPVDYIVPFTQQVHDRVSLEVLRGCTQGCRFCQAGMTTRPVRERTIDNVEKLMERTLEKTGYEEVSLVSLSTCDYSSVQQLVDRVADKAAADRVSVSLPSLRLDSFSVGLADRVADVRRSGLTFAPEAASPRLRAIINKWIPDEELLTMADQAYGSGWKHVKLYFMIGLPTERDDDIEAIADLTLRTLAVGKEHKRTARVNTGVSTFVPKPFTPFQWARQVDIRETERKQAILDSRFGRNPGVKFGRHNAAETFLEGLVTRADRRGADLIEAAFHNGARFDAWGEHLDMNAWNQAIESTGFSVEDALRERALDERLPWDHIDINIPKSWFVEDWERALELKHAEDCRHKRCHKCGVIDVERELCASMLRDNIEARKAAKAYEPTPKLVREPKEGVQRVRFRIGRVDDVRFLSHLEMMNAWFRSLRRARAPLAYTQGFHAHPRINFSAALPTGEETTGDYMDVVLEERADVAELFSRLQATVPKGFLVLGAAEAPLKTPSLMSSVKSITYTLMTPGDREEIATRLWSLMASETIESERTVKLRGKKRGRGRRRVKERKMIDIKPFISGLSVREGEGEVVIIDFETVHIEQKMAKPKEIVALLGLDPVRTRVLKRETVLGEHNVAVQETATC
ncbi:MAG: TIGR03960 family B12-binding radical SAM protein [Proteobacteria bacterium]|nr:TIGR03960 family B12-binding radical SAM protein [Pseudomonadota bacterium]